MLLVYYLVVTFLLVMLTLEKLGFLQIEVTQAATRPLSRFLSDKSVLFIIITGGVAATIHTIVSLYVRKKQKAQKKA
jgi:hypothetical protein